MRAFGTALLFCLSLSASSQKAVSLRLAGDFSFATKGLGLNGAGIGFHLQSNVFCRRRLQLHIETGLDHFAGDKLLTVDLSGTVYERNPTVTRLMAGPEFFVVKQLSIAGAYGAVWSNWLNQAHPQPGVRALLASHLGKRGGLLAGASFTKPLGRYREAQYWSLHLGCRFL